MPRWGKTYTRFNFNMNVSYADPERKEAFHSNARAALKDLAKHLRLVDGSYEVRSNKGGIAVSGEAMLHGDSIYVQVSQENYGASGKGFTIMFRRCRGIKDYTGDRNMFMLITELNNPAEMAEKIRSALGDPDVACYSPHMARNPRLYGRAASSPVNAGV